MIGVHSPAPTRPLVDYRYSDVWDHAPRGIDHGANNSPRCRLGDGARRNHKEQGRSVEFIDVL
jgi:hypothetical protein